MQHHAASSPSCPSCNVEQYFQVCNAKTFACCVHCVQPQAPILFVRHARHAMTSSGNIILPFVLLIATTPSPTISWLSCQLRANIKFCNISAVCPPRDATKLSLSPLLCPVHGANQSLYLLCPLQTTASSLLIMSVAHDAKLFDHCALCVQPQALCLSCPLCATPSSLLVMSLMRDTKFFACHALCAQRQAPSHRNISA